MTTLLPLATALALLLPSNPTPQDAPELELAARPRLVVLIAVEHLRPEHLVRLEPQLAGGLGRMWRAGAVHLAAELGHGVTDDAPGFASAATGVHPRRHGIAGDALRDADADDLRRATADAAVETLGPGGILPGREPGGASPRDLAWPTLGDRLVERFPGARVLSVGGVGPGAVLLGGARAQWALGWDRRVGGFSASSWYGDALPDWVLAWNAEWITRAKGYRFEATLADVRTAGFGPDAREGETPSSAAGAVLPVALPTLGEAPTPLEVNGLASACAALPLGDRFVVDVALAGLAQLELGMDGEPDLLALAPGALGESVRRTGPFSVESAETIAALDRELGRLFDALDAQLGPQGWVAGLASTSGALELPESLRARGVDARRLMPVETRRELAVVRAALEERFGTFFGAALNPLELDLDERALAAQELDAAEARRVARDALVASASWVAAGYTREELVDDAPSDDACLELYRRSYSAERAPDVALRLAPWVLCGQRTGSNSGSPYPYDRSIVLGFLGAGVMAKRSYAEAALVDFMPTLAELVGLELADGAVDGRVLR